MTTKAYDKKNYIFLYRGLLIVRDALLEFIVISLKNFHGENWWGVSVEPAFRSEDIEKLKLQFQKRFSGADGPSRPGKEMYEILDLNYFGNVIEYNWKKVFATTLNNDRTLLAYIKEIVAYRNPVAHTESGDLQDDDTFRGLDTGDRLLRLINTNAADEINKIKNEMRTGWAYEKILGASIPERVGVSIETGFERLEDVIKKDAQAVDDGQVLKTLRQTISTGMISLQNHDDSEKNIEINKLAFERVDKLSQKYLGVAFSQACILFTALPKSTPKEVTQKTLRKMREIDELEKEIHRLEMYLETQKISNLDQTHFNMRQIERKKKILHALQNDLEETRNKHSAPVFFSVIRKLDSFTVQEETIFIVQVEVNNLGKNKTRVSYQEGFSDDLIIIDGNISFEAEIEADSSHEFTYTCLCDKSGTHSLFTKQLDYAEKISGWDVVDDSIVLALPGKGPQLEGKRYYRFAKKGIDVILQITNHGDKKARSINIRETITSKNLKTGELKFQGDIKPAERISINCTMDVSNVAEIVFPEKLHIIFSDNLGKEYSIILDQPFSLLEYAFPPNSEFIGHQVELGQVEKTLKLVAGIIIEGQIYLERRVFLLEGVAGVGKTKFIREIQKFASEKYDFHVHVEDVSKRSPFKRILRSILGIDPNFAPQNAVWEQLSKLGPELLQQRGVLMRFLASEYEKFDEVEVEYLINDILHLIRHLCQNKRYLLIFENAHEFSEGMELEFFQKLVKYASESQDITLTIGISYRPKENLPDAFLGKDIKEGRYEKISLAPLAQNEVNFLINNLIPYPTLSEELQKFIYEWSKGNPYCIKELLRHFFSSEKSYVKRLGDKWYPSSDFYKDTITSEVSAFLLQRAKDDSGKDFPVLQILSVIGLDLPYRLLTAIFPENQHAQRQEKELIDILEKLKRMGILQKSNFESVSELEYKFEHQLMRDAIYEDFYEHINHTFTREQLVTTIINNQHNSKDIFQDDEERLRQIARHLQHAGEKVQYSYREYLKSAAEIEKNKHDFVRALKYYDYFMNCSRKHDNYLEQAQILVDMAIILKLQGNWKPALEKLEVALDILFLEKSKKTKRDVDSLKSKILAEQGFLFIKINNYEKANNYLLRARLNYEGPLRSFRRYFLPHEKAYLEDLIEIYLNLAEIWYRKFDDMPPPASLIDLRSPIFTLQWTMSDVYFNRAETIARKYGEFFSDNRPVVALLVHEGEIFSADEQDLALSKLLDAISFIEKQGATSEANDYAIERAYSCLAEICQKRKEFLKAREYYEKARKIQEKLQDIYGLALSNGGIGRLYLTEKIYDQAEFYLLDAHKYQELVGDTERLWQTSFSLTKIYLASKNHEKAQQYWKQARPFILESTQEIEESELENIFIEIYSFAKTYYDEKAWNDALPLCLDLQVIAYNSSINLVKVDQMLGKIYYELKDAEHALQVLYDELDLTTDLFQRADIYSFLGDICSSTNQGAYHAQTEPNYEACVKIFLENKLSQEALGIYDKLLRYMSSEKDSERLAPYLHGLIDLMFRKHKRVDIRFLEKAEKIFNRYKLYRDAGDAFVHMANKMAILDNPQLVNRWEMESQPKYEREIKLLEKAEQYYSKTSSIDDEVGGYYNLVSVYFRMDAWDNIARCYKLILKTCMTSKEPEIFIDALREVVMMKDKLTFSELKEIITEVENVQLTFESEDGKLTDEQKFTMMLSIAKILGYISDKADEKTDKDYYADLSLKKHEFILDTCSISDIKSVSYNDSALILKSLGRLTEAKERLIKSVEDAKAEKSWFSEACTRANLARLLVETGNASDAKIEYEKSINVLIGQNQYWDQRKKNQDESPLVGDEIARLRFDKRWCALVAEAYGWFLLKSDPNKAEQFLELAHDIFREVQDDAGATRAKNVSELIKKNPAFSPPKPKTLFESDWGRSARNFSYQSAYLQCAACGYMHSTETKKCPHCGAKTCPNCKQIVTAKNEFCENCDQYVGL